MQKGAWKNFDFRFSIEETRRTTHRVWVGYGGGDVVDWRQLRNEADCEQLRFEVGTGYLVFKERVAGTIKKLSLHYKASVARFWGGEMRIFRHL